MHRATSTTEGKKRNAARIRYGNKRHTKGWKQRKIHNLKIQGYRWQEMHKREVHRKQPPVNMPVPKVFSVIKNTNEVLSYFEEVRKLLKRGKNVRVNKHEVEIMTVDTIALLVASINRKDFVNDSIVHGNAPRNKELNKLFLESGFYDHVAQHDGFVKKSDGDQLFKQVSKLVMPDLAAAASEMGINHVFNGGVVIDDLFDILIETMSNTHDHADNDAKGECRWWLYVHNFPNQCRTGYTFVDLGVGIFRSVIVEGYWRQKFRDTPLSSNLELVDDLLAGKIKSREVKDNEIRGKGIPEIVEYAKNDHFAEFYLISNDVKIDLKTGKKEKLQHRLNGTLFYWELYR